MSITRDTFAASIRKDEILSRPISPKLYLGCDTCKMKNASTVRPVRSNPKIDHGSREKRRRSEPNEKLKIKLTDLCDEDKKKIVELIEELSKYAEKNKRLSESVDYLNNVRKEQQEYIMKQATLHLEEKNFYLKEISNYKERLGYYETEMKGKTYKWEVHERFMDNEISYLANAIQRALDDKNDLLQQVNHLKQCLQQSLESFERLKNEVAQMTQPAEPGKSEQPKMNEGQSGLQPEWKVVVLPEVEKKIPEDESEEERPASTKTEELGSTKKSSLNFINEKLNNLYSLLKGKNESPHFDKERNRQSEPNPNPLFANHKIIDTKRSENHYRFVRPKSTKTCFGAEGILKKMEQPFKSNNDGDTSESKFNMKEANFQDLYHEERVLRELFYQKEGSDDYPDPVSFLNGCDFPYEGSKRIISGKN